MIHDYYQFNTVIVGSGAAGLNAADQLYNLGQRDIAIVTEGWQMGTSRNTGSDKQTYYKLSLAGAEKDSVHDLAETLFSGGAMDGDIALVEAALSARCFYNLVRLGVPFPHNQWGEYVGYKTDHDPFARATSAGPLTSKYMVEKLEEEIYAKEIPILDGYQVIAILVDEGRQCSVGLLALNLNELEDPQKRYTLISCTNIVYATGGPAGLYSRSVYPLSQTGGTGAPLEAGVLGKNLTEWQYGIASRKFRWNLSGTYQQVLPRYVSIDENGREEEFLNEYFPDPGTMLNAVFLKGYQWPFDPRKIEDYGSSLIDILVYYENINKKRRVFLDFTRNPTWEGQELDFSWLGEEAFTYLERSGALFGTPIERLEHMNPPAIQLYKDNGIDLYNELLEIAVCAQHNNGGLVGNIWWESNLRHFFPVGEVNGTHGIWRPGGSALNSGQVGGLRAAQFIAARYGRSPLDRDALWNTAGRQIEEKVQFVEELVHNIEGESNLQAMRQVVNELMDQVGAHIRSLPAVESAIAEVEMYLRHFVSLSRLAGLQELGFALKNYDIFITALTYLNAIRDYIEKGGGSRGSYLIYHEEGVLPLPNLPEMFRYRKAEGFLSDQIQLIQYRDYECATSWEPVRPIPEDDNWFETVWAQYRNDEIIR